MTSETLVWQTQDVCGRFQTENWTEPVSTGHIYVIIKHRKMNRKAQNVAKNRTRTKIPPSSHFVF